MAEAPARGRHGRRMMLLHRLQPSPLASGLPAPRVASLGAPAPPVGAVTDQALAAGFGNP